MDLLAAVHQALLERGESVATAESLTGGALAERLTTRPGASAYYLGGVVGYASEVKESLLGVPVDLVEAHGVVSAECARAMAAGVRTLLGATWGVSTTGVAGPTQQEGKAVGTVYVGIAGPGIVPVASLLALSGDRASIRSQTCQEALRLLGAALHD